MAGDIRPEFSISCFCCSPLLSNFRCEFPTKNERETGRIKGSSSSNRCFPRFFAFFLLRKLKIDVFIQLVVWFTHAGAREESEAARSCRRCALCAQRTFGNCSRKMSVVSSRDLTRPGSRSSAMDSRPIYLLERCLAIRFEKSETSVNKIPANQKKGAESRPSSSLSHLSNWLPWQRNGSSINGRKTPSVVSERIREDRPDADDNKETNASVVGRQAAPPGWVYDGGFVLFQVSWLAH